MKLGTPPLQPARLLDQVRERVWCLHYSLKAEKAYLCWIRFLIRYSPTPIPQNQPGPRHPVFLNPAAMPLIEMWMPRCNRSSA